jgi:hypothetical protein
MLNAKQKSLLRVALLLAPFSLGLAACETLENLNPFDESSKKKPLSGDRRAVFPDGVPGVQYSAPPQQPSNSNITINQMQQQNPEPAPEAAEQPPQQQPQRNQKKRANAADDDPWTGARR